MHNFIFLREMHLDNSIKEGCKSWCWKQEASHAQSCTMTETPWYNASCFLFNWTYFTLLTQ